MIMVCGYISLGHAESKYMDYITKKRPDVEFLIYFLVDLLDHF